MLNTTRFTHAGSVLLGAIIFFAVWAKNDRVNDDAQSITASVAATENYGIDHGNGNLVGIQPWVIPGDYANAATLTDKFSTYLQTAQEKGWLTSKTVAIFPEYSGTWLIAAGEKRSIYQAHSTDDALQKVALTHLPEFAYRLLTAPNVADKEKWALFTVKATTAAQSYQHVFSTLAKRYAITVVAGSIVLPQPEIIHGQLVVHPGKKLYNVSAVFDPHGQLIPPLVVKVNPIDEELTFTEKGQPEALPVFSTAAGKLGVLICADAWYPTNYAALKKAGATILAVPSFSSTNGIWSTSWGGYNPGPPPADVDKSDIGRISEADAWLKYAMPLRAQSAGFKAGLNVFLRGQLWDIGSDGATIRQSAQEVGKGALVKGAAITNLWLP